MHTDEVFFKWFYTRRWFEFLMRNLSWYLFQSYTFVPYSDAWLCATALATTVILLLHIRQIMNAGCSVAVFKAEIQP